MIPNCSSTWRTQSKATKRQKVCGGGEVSTFTLELRHKQSSQQAHVGRPKWSVWGKLILDLVVWVAHCGLGGSGGVKEVPSECYQHTGWGPRCWTTFWADPETTFPSGTQPNPANRDSGRQFPPGLLTFHVLEFRYCEVTFKRQKQSTHRMITCSVLEFLFAPTPTTDSEQNRVHVGFRSPATEMKSRHGPALWVW